MHQKEYDGFFFSEDNEITTIFLSKDDFFESFVGQLSRQHCPNTSFRLIMNEDKASPTRIYTGKKCIRFGISSRNRKLFSKPMIEILYRLCACLFLDIIIIPDSVVRNFSVEKWPIVDVFLCFFAKGYPINKAIDYVNLRHPSVINEVKYQKLLFNRKEIYNLLLKNNIRVPEHFVVERDEITGKIINGHELIEDGDSLIFGKYKLTKPFVEKPLNAENHNINIYFPERIGGGCQKLFRKMGNRSSFYCKVDGIRRQGSYIYESFILTDAADVKVYCVGRDYAYAEARKSPALDGKVERDFAGKEMRYPVILASCEKKMARKVVEIFKQDVCGIDMLRTGNQCYICDVNGFSFVKKSTKYYDDCAHMIVGIILSRSRLSGYLTNPLKNPTSTRQEQVENSKTSTLELVSVVALVRHGDRTPKQKMKMLTKHPEFLRLFEKHGGDSEASVKLKKVSELQEVLDITNSIILNNSELNNEAFDNPAKLLQMKYVLEMYGEFMGFNRKVQLRSLVDPRNKVIQQKFKAIHYDRLPSLDISELSLLVILKWGGELTEVGRQEAEEFGQRFSRLYPSEPLTSSKTNFLADTKFSKGLLRLHSTYRHNMKIFASDEGRVQLTAAAFAKGMLALEGQLASTLAHLVMCDRNTTRMLDASNHVEYKLLDVKKSLHEKLSVNKIFDEEHIDSIAAPNQEFVKNQLRFIENPYKACKTIHSLVTKVHSEISSIFKIDHSTHYLNFEVNPSIERFVLCHGETPELMERRWGKLARDFKMKNNSYDISLIPDIYDTARYDYFHNISLNIPHLKKLYEKIKQFAQVVISQEYGTTAAEKLDIGRDVCRQVIKKISSDLKHDPNFYIDEGHVLDADSESSVSNPRRRVRSRIYFTSESHIFGLLNVFHYGGLFNQCFKGNKLQNPLYALDSIGEYDFLSSILILQYEDCLMNKDDPDRFKIDIFFSPGNRRNEPISQAKQLARPTISRSHKKSLSQMRNMSARSPSLSDKSSNDNLFDHRDMQHSLITNIPCSRPQNIIPDVFRHHSESTPSEGAYSSTNTISQLRRPCSIGGNIINQQIHIADSLFDFKPLGCFIPRKIVTDFLDYHSS